MEPVTAERVRELLATTLEVSLADMKQVEITPTDGPLDYQGQASFWDIRSPAMPADYMAYRVYVTSDGVLHISFGILPWELCEVLWLARV